MGLQKFEKQCKYYQFIPIGKGSHFAPTGILPANNTLKLTH